MKDRDLLAQQPGRPPAVFDPVRRALWDADVREQRALLKDANLTPQKREMKAAAVASKDARRLCRRVFALPTGRQRRMDFASIKEASRRLHVCPSALDFAIKNGTLCRGREWWWTSRPLSERPMRIRRPKLIANGRIILADGYIFESIDAFMKSAGMNKSMAYRCLKNRYFNKRIDVYRTISGGIAIGHKKYPTIGDAAIALEVTPRTIYSAIARGHIRIHASVKYLNQTIQTIRECAA